MKTKSYEELMEECLKDAEKVMDTREGSLAYIISSAFALQLAELYSQMQEIEDNAFVLTAQGEYLDMAVELIGMERKSATKPVVKIEGPAGFSVGDIFTGGDYRYKVVQVYDGYYFAECTTSGEEANNYMGEVLPLKDKANGAIMTITKIVAAGEEKESDEALRERFSRRVRVPVCTGNLAYYRQAIENIQGVGSIKVVPVPEGIGTVKVIITDNEFEKASDELVSYVKETLDPTSASGLGYGVVPIGHKVSVESVEVVDVDIVCETEPLANSEFFYRMGRSKIPLLFDEINKSWHENDNIVLLDRTIEDYFFELGATDVNVISLNGQPNRLKLKENQILGEVTINGA